MSKLTRAFKSGINIFIIALFIDFLFTLFKLNESGFYTSRMGIEVNHIINEEIVSTTFTLNNKIYIYFIAIIALMYISIQAKTYYTNHKKLSLN